MAGATVSCDFSRAGRTGRYGHRPRCGSRCPPIAVDGRRGSLQSLRLLSEAVTLETVTAGYGLTQRGDRFQESRLGRIKFVRVGFSGELRTKLAAKEVGNAFGVRAARVR